MTIKDKIIEMLEIHGTVSQPKLEKLMNMSQSYLSRELINLEKKGLITRELQTFDTKGLRGGKTFQNLVSLTSNLDDDYDDNINDSVISDSQITDQKIANKIANRMFNESIEKDNAYNDNNDKDNNDDNKNTNISPEQHADIMIDIGLLNKRVAKLEALFNSGHELIKNTQAYDEHQEEKNTELIMEALDLVLYRSSKDLVQLTGIKRHTIQIILRKLVRSGEVETNYRNSNNPNMAYRKK